MAELTSDAAPHVGQVAVKPKGILPGNLQNWVMVGGGLLMVLFILFNTGGSTKDKKAAAAAAAAKPVVIDPSQARIQEYRKQIDSEAAKLKAEEERLREVQESLGVPPTGQQAGALQAMYPPGPNAIPPAIPQNAQKPAVDSIQADREKREYASLFASNVALSYRPAAATNTDAKAAEKTDKAGDRQELGPAPALPFTTPLPNIIAASPAIANPASADDAGKAARAKQEPDEQEEDAKPRGQRTKSPTELRQADGAQHRLFEGTVLETVLTNRLAGDFSGPVNCLVSANVYSHNRQHLLIPQGSRALGEVKRVTNFGQQRVAVFFHRLIMPDGYSVDLDQFQGLNQIGETGLKDQVNHHYAAIFGSSLALGAIAGFSQSGTSGGLVTSGTDSYRQGFSSSLSQSSQRILDKFLNQLPTITIREGYRVKVYLAGDLLVPDYNLHRLKDDL